MQTHTTRNSKGISSARKEMTLDGISGIQEGVNTNGHGMYTVVSELKTGATGKIYTFRRSPKSSGKQSLPSCFIFLTFNINIYRL